MIKRSMSFVFRLIEAKLLHSHQNRLEEIPGSLMHVDGEEELNVEEEDDEDIEVAPEGHDADEIKDGSIYVKSKDPRENLRTRLQAVSLCI